MPTVSYPATYFDRASITSHGCYYRPNKPWLSPAAPCFSTPRQGLAVWAWLWLGRVGLAAALQKKTIKKLIED